ncbi:MAG: twin-arginine translocase subunit TatC [Sulfolobales archaeon]
MSINQEEKRMSLLEHLDELRARILRVFIAYIIISIILFAPLNLFYSNSDETTSKNSVVASNPLDYIIMAMVNFLNRLSGQGYDSLTTRFIIFTKEYMLPENTVIISGGATVAIFTIIKTTLTLSILLISPYVAYEILAFVWPALYPHERRIVRKYVFIASVYLLMGILVGYFIVARSVVRAGYFWSISVGAQYYLNISNFIDDVITSMLGSLIVFVVPLAMIIATELGFLNPHSELIKNRKILYTIAWILLVFFLPDVTAVILFLIFILVYEPSFIYMKHIAKRKIRESGAIT